MFAESVRSAPMAVPDGMVAAKKTLWSNASYIAKTKPGAEVVVDHEKPNSVSSCFTQSQCLLDDTLLVSVVYHGYISASD
ncbi:hypothetical protein M422DRAFT_29206 [Sphaerobolus stellatus SS14]|uniref:Unplaced genomic scaffold SPHSTscaffold_473, whole genome shotgun sequence n=1 Tax=Sphaerobolus stellatus (strain SS14) TaxID=990650 RepID=A0A0C9W4W7_SPHS4|nr:hypothetical protein M422DRAFT_39336 [Sphaerobolus stellatus SS14]KIJ46723.1 hypothetical protein M422DRAFT_29206 [Sphaerobolus stellatus SS14]